MTTPKAHPGPKLPDLRERALAEVRKHPDGIAVMDLVRRLGVRKHLLAYQLQILAEEKRVRRSIESRSIAARTGRSFFPVEVWRPL